MLRNFGKWEKEESSLGEQGFYKIPSQPELCIKPEGIVFSKKDQKNLENKFNEYVDVNFRRTTYKLHNFLAEAFLEVPKELLDLERSKLIANHKDGDKHNFDLDNLEWTTYSGNIIHAYKSGLRTDNNRVLALNIHTEEVIDFYSQAECARFFEVDPVNVMWWLKAKKAFGTKRGFFVFKYETDEWPEILNSNFKPNRSDIFAKSVEPNGLSYLFPSIVATEDYLGIKRGNLRTHIYRHGTKPYRGFEFHYLYMYLDKIESEKYQKITKNSPPLQ